jgi:hypothetical protein
MQSAIVLGALLSGFWVSAVLVGWTAIIIIGSLSWHGSRWRNPIAYFLYSLFQALRQLSKEFSQPGAWDPPEQREQLLCKIEEAARCLEILRERMPVQDPIMERASKEAFESRTAYLRGLKMWILVPQAASRFNLEKELRRILELAASGDWDGLPQAKLDQATNAVPWPQRAWYFTRDLIIAFVPLLAVATLNQNQQLKVDEPLKGYIILASWIWALITVLGTIDPNLEERVSRAKDLVGIFMGAKKEK